MGSSHSKHSKGKLPQNDPKADPRAHPAYNGYDQRSPLEWSSRFKQASRKDPMKSAVAVREHLNGAFMGHPDGMN